MHAEEDALERRIVTVLFADLVGFTPLSERFDAEDVAAIQDRYFALARETIDRYGGRIEKFIGDAVMAVFGAERSATTTSSALCEPAWPSYPASSSSNAAMGLDEDVLQLRVGHQHRRSGRRRRGRQRRRVTGDTVNTAARFQAAAPAGGVLIGASTALAVAEVAELGDPLNLELKGKSEPTRRARCDRAPCRAISRAGDGRLCGRRRSAGSARIGRPTGCSRANRGRIVERWLMVAPPGVGKSRLLREMADRSRHRIRARSCGDRAPDQVRSRHSTHRRVALAALATTGPRQSETRAG